MTISKIRAEIVALQNVAIEDLMAMTDDEIRKEVLEEGENLEEIAQQVKSSMREVAADFMRQRMTRAKSCSHLIAKCRVSQSRPPLERIKQIIQELFATNPNLGLAYREGKRQTDSDWDSLYDDLIAMGVIKQKDDGH